MASAAGPEIDLGDLVGTLMRQIAASDWLDKNPPTGEVRLAGVVSIACGSALRLRNGEERRRHSRAARRSPFAQSIFPEALLPRLRPQRRQVRLFLLLLLQQLLPARMRGGGVRFSRLNVLRAGRQIRALRP